VLERAAEHLVLADPPRGGLADVLRQGSDLGVAIDLGGALGATGGRLRRAVFQSRSR